MCLAWDFFFLKINVLFFIIFRICGGDFLYLNGFCGIMEKT